jgi:hypothetical protein
VRRILLVLGCLLWGALAEAAITVPTAAPSACVANNATCTATLPAHAADDLLLCYVFHRNADTNDTLGTPAGWTQLYQEFSTQGTAHGQHAIYYLVATSGAETNPGFTITNGAAGSITLAQCGVFRGVDTADPVDVAPTAGSFNAASQNIGPITGITPMPSGAAVIVFGFKIISFTDRSTLTTGGLSWVEMGEVSSTQGNDGSLMWDYVIFGGAPSAVGNSTFTLTGIGTQFGGGIMMSLNPAGGGGGATPSRRLLMGVGE